MFKSPVHIQGDKLMEDRTFEENLVNDGMAQADAKVTEAEEERHDGQILSLIHI